MPLRRALPAAWLAVSLVAGCATTPSAPEPAGFWSGASHGPTPRTLTGGRVVHVSEVAALIERGAVVLVDASAAPRRPGGLAPGALWLPAVHKDIPGSLWAPGAGADVVTPAFDAVFRSRLDNLTRQDRLRPIVVYCHPQCWLSWNAAKRVVGYGYRNVAWYPDGIDGWERTGRATSATAPDAALSGASE